MLIRLTNAPSQIATVLSRYKKHEDTNASHPSTLLKSRHETSQAVKHVHLPARRRLTQQTNKKLPCSALLRAGEAMEGIFPFFCSAIRRRRPRPPDRYERLAVPGGLGREHESLAGGGRYQHSQSCRFPARRPGADELGLGRDDDRPPPEDLSGELSPASGGRDGGRGLSRSRRFGSMRMLASCIGGP
ncbi:hypothetical protein D1007_22641 [Hordeum vulgare]|nr:hypothetical protein D1007_22641 [Hordeum vulgare]